MTARRDESRLPAWTIVRSDDPRERPGAVETPAFVSAEWAATIRAASNRPWINAAKVIATIVDARPDARYVEGWASKFGPEWHAWVDVPLAATEQAWLRIDATPLWRWTLEHNRYCPVLEVRASDLAPFVAPLLRPRGRAHCRLPLVSLAPAPKLAMFHPVPDDALAAQFGDTVAARALEARAALATWEVERVKMTRAEGQAELDRLAAMRVLPKAR